MLSSKKILIGITGGIAAYKVCELIRQLVKLGAITTAIITPSAKEFVTETTLRTLTQNQVYCEQFHVDNWKPEHISLADDSDLFIIAPASANTIGKIANGICDNLLTSVVAAFRKPIILAPAMNCNMWNNNFVQNNITTLKNAGFCIIPPEEGELACGYIGAGRLAKVDNITNKAVEILTENQFLKGKKVLVTAGGTKEPIDPVRYIGNHSSGKMGTAIADMAHSYGAEVILISTVNSKKNYRVINVNTAEEMLNVTKTEFQTADALIMSAAVADYKIKNQYTQKIKKNSFDSESITLELVKNPDILKEIAKIKSEKQLVVGFCAESENLLANAKKKIKSKNADYIIANDISNPEIGFNSDYNAVSIIDKNGNIMEIPKSSKIEIAKIILKQVFQNEV